MAGDGDKQSKQPGRPRATAAVRRERIALELARQGYTSGGALAAMFGVSEMTIRRDFDAMAADGKLWRAHGGAVGIGTTRLDMTEPDMAERIGRNRAAKSRIAASAAAMVAPGSFVGLDIGSTTLCLAQALTGRNVRFLTCSLKIAAFLGGAGESVVTPGGTVQGSEPSLAGAMTRRQIEAFHFDVVFIGISGIAATGLYDYSLEDAEIKRALVERAARVVAVADSSKFDRLSVAKVCALSDLHALVTDAPPPSPLAQALAAAGVSLTVAERERS
jgi:DeoR family glycerol-3-phosphate regulon repressor